MALGGHHRPTQDVQLRSRLARHRDERVRVPVVPHDDLPVLCDAQVDLDGVRTLALDRTLVGLDRVLDRHRAGAPMSHDQELHGVHIQDPRRCGQDDGAHPYESTADPLHHDHQGHEQEALPQARRGDRLARQAAHVSPLSLLHGADGTTQARSADEARSTDASMRSALQPLTRPFVLDHGSLPSSPAADSVSCVGRQRRAAERRGSKA